MIEMGYTLKDRRKKITIEMGYTNLDGLSSVCVCMYGRKQVSGEMTQWERSGQWLPSSFSPLKAHPPLVGFTDTSPEEFRIQAYTANKTNTYAAYVSVCVCVCE